MSAVAPVATKQDYKVANLDLAGILHGLLPWPLPQRLDELAPRTLEVPSGSRIRLDYSDEMPVLAVRLQELFGLRASPVAVRASSCTCCPRPSARCRSPRTWRVSGAIPTRK